ncbi:MAG: hypothetical protein ABIJ97_08335 [Bacteroidota bacterium]
MRPIIYCLLGLFLVTSACDKDEDYKERIITSDIVGKWYSKKSQDSITHDYTVNGKLTVQKFSSNNLNYTGYFDYDIVGQTIEYWGENTDGVSKFQIFRFDTLWVEKFINVNYTFYRISATN